MVAAVVAKLIIGALATSLNPIVDLEYSIYRGFTNTTTNLNIWRGQVHIRICVISPSLEARLALQPRPLTEPVQRIRYAAPPTGALRFNKPQPPKSNRSNIIDAFSYGSQCVQHPPSDGQASSLGARVERLGPASEDCLFLNVWAPVNASKLPVMVWIHGGGYGQRNASQEDLSQVVMTNDHSFVAVSIQYRLGAFGFLSSDEVHRDGVANAGIHDIILALRWVQQHISKFGGNPSRVTIAGNSAGAGAVMLLNMAYGGTMGTALFEQSFASSPFLPKQYGYKDYEPSQAYYAFAYMAGCGSSSAARSVGPTVLDCLRTRDSETLMRASQNVSASGLYGTWALQPVIDGELIRDLPSRQLSRKKVNGRRIVTGNVANEGAPFVPYGITTDEDLMNWIHITFPQFGKDDIARLLRYYPSSESSTSNGPLFATTGTSPPTAITQSSVATGNQQGAYAIYSEATFICPSYWLAEAFSEEDTGKEKQAWKYQYSVPLALHGSDVAGFLGLPSMTAGPELKGAFQKMLGNFIRRGDPSLPADLAVESSAWMKAVSPWPTWGGTKSMLNLNQTGGRFVEVPISQTVNATEYVGLGLENDFSVVNAMDWEGGRGLRCDFWRSMGRMVPE